MDKSVVTLGVIALKEEGVVAYPSEGVWGLGCDPFSEKAVRRILHLKARPVEKGLILVASSLEQIKPLLAGLSDEQRTFLHSVWPGPDTWILPDPNQVIPQWIKGSFATVAIRVSMHPLVQELCQSFGGLIVSTSANPGSLPPAMTREQVKEYFSTGVDVIVPGNLGEQNGPSTIRDLLSSETLRGM